MAKNVSTKAQAPVSAPEATQAPSITHLAPFGNPDAPELDVCGDNALPTAPEATQAPARISLDDFLAAPAPALRPLSMDDFYPQAPGAGKAKKAPTLKTGEGLDPFGNRLGTALAAVNLELANASSPLTMKQICIRCHKFGTDTYYNHMRKLTTLGLAEKANGGYQLTAEGRKLYAPPAPAAEAAPAETTQAS